MKNAEQKKIVYRKPSDLIAAEYNPRKLSDDQFAAIADSIKRFGFIDPVIVNKHPDRMDILVGGHQRLKVARSLELETVPTVEIKLDLEKEKELNIRLNKNTGSWDAEAMEQFFEPSDLEEWGFKEWELPESAVPDDGEFWDDKEPDSAAVDDFERLVLKLQSAEMETARKYMEANSMSAEAVFLAGMKE